MCSITKFEKDFGLVLKEGKIVVSSRVVADKYGKDHRNVLAKIDGFIDAIPELGVLNFKQTPYIAENGETYREFIMDRQGFSILVNKFTGKEALKFTYQYSQAFEEMAKDIEQLQKENKQLDKIAISDVNQKQRLLEANKIAFSERRTQKSFANCESYQEYKDLHTRFMDYISCLDADDRVIKMRLATQGMEKLRQSLLIKSINNIGDTINIDTDIKYLLKQIDKVNNKIIGGEKAGKTKTINKLLAKAEPSLDCFTKIDYHGISNNYLYMTTSDGTFKTETYKKWLRNFPVWQIPEIDSFDLDLDKEIEIFIKYVAKSDLDVHNFDKASIDIITHELGFDDKIVTTCHSSRLDVCDNYNDGKIYIYLRNL